MSAPLRTCSHIFDTGAVCDSIAATGQKFCASHLRFRARQLRIAQARARNLRYHIQLPLLENMHAIHSALTQLAEAIAAGMIDLKHADRLMAVLRLASNNLMHPEKWQASVYHSDVAAPPVDVAKEYGLPADLDLETPPEIAFPLPAEPARIPTGDWQPPTADAPDPFHRLNVLERLTPNDVELNEIQRTQGVKAMLKRAHQLEYNELRRKRRADARLAQERFSALALQQNIERAAEKLAQEKLSVRPPLGGPQLPDSGNSGYATPPAANGLGVVVDTAKKPVSSAVAHLKTAEKSVLTPTG